MQKKKLALFGILISCFCFMFICFATDYAKAGGPGRVTVFAADPDQGTFGMYREGTNYVFFEIKAGNDGGKVATSVKFHDKDMNHIAGSDKNSPAAFTPAAKNGTFTENNIRQYLVASAARELGKHPELAHDVFTHEKAALADFEDMFVNSSVNKQQLKAKAAGTNHANRALKAKDYFTGLQKNLKWNKKGTEIAGNYNGTKLHGYARKIVPGADAGDDGLDAENPGQPRIERYGRMADANDNNIVQQFGGHEIAPGYRVNPKDGEFAGGTSVDPLETIELRYKAKGEAFMAGSVIKSHKDFPAEEKEMFARMGSGIELLPSTGVQKDGEMASVGAWAKFKNTATDKVRSWFKPKNALASSVYRHRVAIHTKCLTTCNLHHTGSIVDWDWANGCGGPFYTSWTVIFCNHGTCPRAAGITYKCQWYTMCLSAFRNIPSSNNASPSGGDGNYHSCHSGYNSTNVTTCMSHVCNDDTWTQVRATKGWSYCLDGCCGDRCGTPGIAWGDPSCTD